MAPSTDAYRALRWLSGCAAAVALVLACTANDGGGAGSATGAGSDAGAGGRPDAGPDGAALSYCAAYASYRKGCGKGLLCETNFEAWCPSFEASSSAVSNAAYVACAGAGKCADQDFKDCLYVRYTGTKTAAQAALVHAVCTQCDPQNVAACEVANTTYDRGQGPASVTDLFLAVWESSDAVATTMATTCTGPGHVDAGVADGSAGDAAAAPTAAACFSAFSSCAAGVYLDAIPNCP